MQKSSFLILSQLAVISMCCFLCMVEMLGNAGYLVCLLTCSVTSHWWLIIIYDKKYSHHRNCQHCTFIRAFSLFGDVWLNIYQYSLAKLFLKENMWEGSPFSLIKNQHTKSFESHRMWQCGGWLSSSTPYNPESPGKRISMRNCLHCVGLWVCWVKLMDVERPSPLWVAPFLM